MNSKLFLAVLVVVLAVSDGQRPTVQTTSGYLKGVVSQINGRPLVKFLGVPYAKKPERFAVAEDLDATTAGETLDAGQFRPSCVQPAHLRKLIYRPLHDGLDDSMVSEDCLNLNIYVPGRRINDTGASPMAVMVWIPGEGFDYGFANQYDGSRLAVHGQVIVVTVNYRLSAFGFLSTGDSQAPGNLGLKDQLMALKWLKQNIGRIGGDAERVTVFGRLTGSMSISALLLSTVEGPKYFQRAIMQSGVAQSDWVFETNPLEQALVMAKNVGCGQSGKVNTTRLISCLRKVPSKTLMKSAMTVERPWRMVLDGDFLDETPLNRVGRGRVDANIQVMLGANEHDGSVCILSHLVAQTEYMDKILNNTLSNDDLGHLVHSHVNDYYGASDDDLRAQAHALYKCGAGKNMADCRQQFLNFCGDLYSHSAVTEMAEKLTTVGSDVYRYEFAHRPTFSHYPDFVGAAQGDEVVFVFGLVDEEAKLDNVTQDEIRLGHQMMTMWTNFAKSGNPNPFQDDIWWPTYNENGEYLRITRRMGPQAVQKATPNDQINFWMNLNRQQTSR